jgi:hypothetical protein
MKVILTGATGMVGEGVLLECLENAHTDSSEQGRVMWARVKGKAENALCAFLSRESTISAEPDSGRILV